MDINIPPEFNGDINKYISELEDKAQRAEIFEKEFIESKKENRIIEEKYNKLYKDYTELKDKYTELKNDRQYLNH